LIKEIKIFDRLKHKNEIESVYKKGNVVISTDKKLKANYLSIDSETNKLKIAISVSSKEGNSVWRNRLKRIIRESVRQEELVLKEIVLKNKLELLIIFSPYRINKTSLHHPFLKEIKPVVADILNMIRKKIVRDLKESESSDF
jgi:ribonuclease P protein component